MRHDEMQEAARDVITEDRYPPKKDHRYGPSQVSGCPLRKFLSDMMAIDVRTNSYLFQGSAVHFYMQQNGLLDEIVEQAGYHPGFTEYEVMGEVEVGNNVYIHGSADVITEEKKQDRDHDTDKVVYDMKYSGIPFHSGHGRLFKYLSQAHAYSRIHDADGYGLLMIQSNVGDPDEFVENIGVVEGVMDDENWELMKQKALNIDNALVKSGYYDDNEWDQEEIADMSASFWEEVIEYFDTTHTPAYEKECKYCEHKEYCPVYQGTLGGLKSLVD